MAGEERENRALHSAVATRDLSVLFLSFTRLKKKKETENYDRSRLSVFQEAAAPIQKFFFGSFQMPVNKVSSSLKWNLSATE